MNNATQITVNGIKTTWGEFVAANEAETVADVSEQLATSSRAVVGMCDVVELA
jgi:hypothetical protein